MATDAIDFKGRTALVIGGTTGIGRATALRFAAGGANVFIAGLGKEDGRAVESAVRKQHGVDAEFLEADVRRESDIQAVMARAIERFGRVHAAVNNAGTEGRFGPVQDATIEDFDRTIGINLRGVWLGMKYEIAHMLANGGGAIVNTSSIAGLVGLRHFSTYAASKHGIIGLTKTAALENMKFGVRINAICPASIDTEMIDRAIIGNSATSNPSSPIQQIAQAAHQYVGRKILARDQPGQRLGRPEEVAQAVMWLCSDEASFVTGYAMPVDGGYAAR